MQKGKQNNMAKPAENRAAKTAKKELVEVVFIKSPAAIFFLGHRPGQKGKFTAEQVEEFEAAGVAEKI